MILLPAILVGDVPWTHRAVVAGALVAPLPMLLILGVLSLRSRRGQPVAAMGEEAAGLLGVLASLQAGHTLRAALSGLSNEVDRLVTVGASTGALAAALERALGDQGRVAGAAVRLLDRAGGPAVPVFEELAAQAAETERIRRELRSAVAAPVLQGLIIGGAPLAVLVFLVASGELTRIFTSSPAHALTVSAGAAMTVVGVTWVVAIVRKALP